MEIKCSAPDGLRVSLKYATGKMGRLSNYDDEIGTPVIRVGTAKEYARETGWKSVAGEKRDKALGNCHCCSAIFIRSREQSFLKALQIAWPVRPIRRSSSAGGGYKFSLFYSQRLVYIRNKQRTRKGRADDSTGRDKEEERAKGAEMERRQKAMSSKTRKIGETWKVKCRRGRRQASKRVT